MTIVEVSTGKTHSIEVLPIEIADFESLSEERYFFNWKEEKEREVYKLILKGQMDVLGLLSLERISSEWRVHIRLLTVSKENMGSGKIFENIGACLIAFAAKIAVTEYGELACISLTPKTEIAQHYMDKYNMKLTGRTLSLEVPEIINLIIEYDHD